MSSWIFANPSVTSFLRQSMESVAHCKLLSDISSLSIDEFEPFFDRFRLPIRRRTIFAPASGFSWLNFATGAAKKPFFFFLFFLSLQEKKPPEIPIKLSIKSWYRWSMHGPFRVLLIFLFLTHFSCDALTPSGAEKDPRMYQNEMKVINKTLVLRPSKFRKNNTQGGDKHYEAMHFK